MPLTSAHPPLDIPNVDLWTLLFGRRELGFSNQKVIFTDDTTKRSLNYTQIKASTIAFGHELKYQFSWKKGDVLTICSPNNIDMASMIWGCHWAGGVVNPVSPALTERELATQLKDACTKVLVLHDACRGLGKRAAKAAGIPEENIIMIGNNDNFKRRYDLDSQGNLSKSVLRQTEVNPGDTAFLMFSSGTSGKPKAVILTHRNVVSNVLQSDYVYRKNYDLATEKVLGFLPFYHIYGLMVLVLLPVYEGVPVVVMQTFNLQRFCEIIQESKITKAFIVPPVALLLTKAPIVKNYDLSSVRSFTCAAAPLAKELISTFHNTFGVPIVQSYGITEASPAITIQDVDQAQIFPGSVGRLVPNLTAKIISFDSETELKQGEAGELWIRGPNVFSGYYNNPTATRDALTSDGYYRTGDVGFFDKENNFYITDRVKELIKYKGSQVAPAELEDLLLCHPQVSDCAVIGVYDETQATELPRAYIVLTPGVTECEELKQEITEWVKERVAPFKRLRGGIIWSKAIPKSPTGKILRRVLRDAVGNDKTPLKAKI